MLNDAALVIAANAIDAAIDGMRLHSGARGAAGTTNQVGSLAAIEGTVDADGDITWANVPFTGLAADQAVAEISLWAGATYMGGGALTTGDTTANAAGEYTVVEWVETSSAT